VSLINSARHYANKYIYYVSARRAREKGCVQVAEDV